MPKKLLIERRVGSLQLNESKDHKVRPGCLGTLKGPCADYRNPTRNGNFYSRKLWQNSFGDPLVVESIEDLTCIGELDHPGDRLETKATNACIVFTGYEFDDANGVVVGTFDILDTPNGRILKSLIDYGCKIGVSSRGEGDVIEEADRTVVDEDAFEFVAFDAVVLPAVKAAKPALSESVQRSSLRESLQKEIDNAQTPSELSLIESVIKTINPPDSETLLESVNHKSQDLASGTTSSPALLEDLEKAMSQVQSLTEEVNRLKADLTTCKSKYYRQIGNRQKVIKESAAQKGKIKELEEKYSAQVFESASTARKIEGLKRDLSQACARARAYQKQVETHKTQEESKDLQIKNLQKALRESQSFGQDKLRRISQLEKEFESFKNEKNRELRESFDRRQTSLDKLRSRVIALQSDCNEAVDAFIDAKCQSTGVSATEIRESLKTSPTKDLKTATALIESSASRARRYDAMPVIEDKLIGALQEGTLKFSSGQIYQDREALQTQSFMDEANKLF